MGKSETLLDSLMAKITGARGNGSTFMVTVFLVLAAMLIIAIMAARLAMAKRKAVATMVKLRQAEDAVEAAKNAQKLADNEHERAQAGLRLEAAASEVKDLQKAIASAQADHAVVLNDLGTITSWDDIVVSDKRQ